MRTWSFCWYGHNTTEIISIGEGPWSMMHWGLPQFPGPTLWTHWLGLSERRLIHLPLDLLLLLYERFRRANPDGLSIAEAGELESRFAGEMTAQQCHQRYERRKLFVSLTLTDAGEGYPHLRRYLPEVFELPLLRELAADPWLDAQRLALAVPALELGDEPGGLDAQGGRLVSPLGRSERWWPQWRDHCDALQTQALNSTVKPPSTAVQ